MSKIGDHVIRLGESGVPVRSSKLSSVEPRVPEDLPEFNQGTWYQSVDGVWFAGLTNIEAVVRVRINGKDFVSTEDHGEPKPWWFDLDQDMQSNKPPFYDAGIPTSHSEDEDSEF